MNIEELERFNPWWKTGSVRESWLKKYRRKVYFEIERHIERRQVIMIWGLRRVGKTTVMFQVLQRLLNRVKPRNILYFSFDEMAFDFRDVLESYQKLVLHKTFDELHEKVYLFLDEIQKVSDWENKIKTYYDLYPDVKFILSGSASVRLRKRSGESLAGRIMDFLLKPLSFEEFLEMNGKDTAKIRESPDMWGRELLPLFYRYMKYGMFPELVGEEDEEFARKYILNNVVERVVYKDLPEEFGSKDVELLKRLMYIAGKSPGMIVNYSEISKDLGKDQRTIANYFEYLEYGLLIQFVFNYRGSHIASMRKMKKLYLSTPNIAFAFAHDPDRVFPQMLENLILSETGARFFYRNGFEIDFILPEDGRFTAIEVKKEERDVKQMRKLIEKFGDKVEKAVIVDMEKEGRVEGIEIVPAWRFLLKCYGENVPKID